MKVYEVKTYSANGTFKKQINPLNINTDISFTEEINGWQGNLNMTITWDLDDYSCSDIVEIREIDDETLIITATYTWIIEEIDVREYNNWESLTFSILGIFTILNDTIYKKVGNPVFTETWTVWNMIKLIIDSFNADYGTLTWWDTQNLTTNAIRYTWSSIDVTGTTINREFDQTNCLDAIKLVIEDTWFDFFIGPDGICYVTAKADQEEVFVTHDRELIYIQRQLTKKDMVNKLYLERNWGTSLTYDDATSISTYWLKEKFISDTSIQDATTQNLVGWKKILEFKDPRNVITMLLRPQVWNFLYPWKLITTQNTKRSLVQKQITKIDKWSKQWKVYFWEFISFWKTILWG